MHEFACHHGAMLNFSDCSNFNICAAGASTNVIKPAAVYKGDMACRITPFGRREI